jgi:hypothetical protein
MFVFDESFGRTQMRRVIARELGFSWKQAPVRAAPIDSARSLLVFATDTQVVSSVLDRDVGFGCLDTVHHNTAAQTRYHVYRSAGSPADPASHLPASPPTLVALSSLGGGSAYERLCAKGLGVLH